MVFINTLPHCNKGSGQWYPPILATRKGETLQTALTGGPTCIPHIAQVHGACDFVNIVHYHTMEHGTLLVYCSCGPWDFVNLLPQRRGRWAVELCFYSAASQRAVGNGTVSVRCHTIKSGRLSSPLVHYHIAWWNWQGVCCKLCILSLQETPVQKCNFFGGEHEHKQNIFQRIAK